MDTEHAAAADLELLRAAFPEGEPLGWEGVRAFEAEHGEIPEVAEFLAFIRTSQTGINTAREGARAMSSSCATSAVPAR